ncbi:MAG TPA: tetratricopeptide repeat protein [Crenotrichaceae bacterium]|nr:tetratricopeptide repeat protein [Crenotrichaceae bacterium]
MRRWSIIFAWILAIGFGYLALREAQVLSRTLNYNDALENPQNLADYSELTPQFMLIQAWALQQQGNTQQALALYNSITQADPADFAQNNQQQIRETALYNIGVINLKQAAEHWNEKGVWAYTEVTMPLNLAKQAFKSVLRSNPRHWNARYNLDYALRITPPPKEREKQGMTESRSSVHAILPGLPGGGP